MRDHLKKTVILHSFHKKFKFELISVVLINATDKGNISHIMDVATLLQHNKWNTDGLKKMKSVKLKRQQLNVWIVTWYTKLERNEYKNVQKQLNLYIRTRKTD